MIRIRIQTFFKAKDKDLEALPKIKFFTTCSPVYSPRVALFEVAELSSPARVAHARVSHTVSMRPTVQVTQFYQHKHSHDTNLTNNKNHTLTYQCVLMIPIIQTINSLTFKYDVFQQCIITIHYECLNYKLFIVCLAHNSFSFSFNFKKSIIVFLKPCNK